MTKLLFKSTLCVLFFISTIPSSLGQNMQKLDLENSLTYSSSLTQKTINLRNYDINIDDYKLDYTVEDAPKSITENEAQEMVMNYAVSMIAFGAGLGIISDQTLWCLHAEYYMRLVMLKQGAIYGALGAAYSSSSSDYLTANLLDVTLKVLMVSLLVKQYQQVRFLYGLFGGYGFGKDKFDNGYDYDITRLTLGILIGFQIMLTTNWALMIQTNLFNYQELTRKHEDFEVTDYSRWTLINKSNLLAFSLVYTFANSKR